MQVGGAAQQCVAQETVEEGDRIVGDQLAHFAAEQMGDERRQRIGFGHGERRLVADDAPRCFHAGVVARIVYREMERARAVAHWRHQVAFQ